MIILLTASDVKGESVGTDIGEMTENDFYMSLGGWVYLVAYIQGEHAMIFRHGNSNERKLVSVNKLWQLISRTYELCRDEDPMPEDGANRRIEQMADTLRKLSPASRIAHIKEGWHRRPRRFGLKPSPDLSILDEE